MLQISPLRLFHLYSTRIPPDLPQVENIIDLVFRSSPSVYIVFPTIIAGNTCSQVGNKSFTSITLTILPEELSTIEGKDGATKMYNFADLPCPPASIAAADSYYYYPSLDPGMPYQPRISPPAALRKLDPAWQDCVMPGSQGWDPASPLAPAKTPTSVNSNQHPPREALMEQVTPATVPMHRVQYIPLQTTSASNP